MTDRCGDNLMFKVCLPPDPSFQNFTVGQCFVINSVNRKTGEIIFSLDHQVDPDVFNKCLTDK